MKHTFNQFLQVAGIIDQSESDLLLSLGIEYFGFPLRLPVNKEDLTEETAAQIISSYDATHFGIIISYSKTSNEALSICNKLNTNIIQLHGPIELNEVKKLKNRNITIIKSLVIKNDNKNQLEQDVLLYQKYVDAFITDTYNPITKASGATGKTHDWNISKQLVEISSKPVILAGGLTPENVYEAILYVKPSGVDVHSGVENETGRKDKNLVTKFITEDKKAYKELSKNESKRISKK